MTKPNPREQIRAEQEDWTASTLQPALDRTPSTQKDFSTLSEIPIDLLATPLDRAEGSYLEQVGFYDPLSEPKTIRFEKDRVLHWISVGAQPSATVHNLLVKSGVIEGAKQRAHATKPAKKEEVSSESVAADASDPAASDDAGDATDDTKADDSLAEESTEDVKEEKSEEKTEDSVDNTSDKVDTTDTSDKGEAESAEKKPEAAAEAGDTTEDSK